MFPVVVGLGASLVVGYGASGPALAAAQHPAPPVAVTAAPAEVSPQGDISDTVAYVPWVSADRRIRFTHPEGWSQTAIRTGVRFVSKLDSVTMTVTPGPRPSVSEVRAKVAPSFGKGRASQIVAVQAAGLPAGRAVRVTWRVNSAPDPVTGKAHRDEVVTYLLGSGGRVVRLDLSGPVGADNVDPYRIMAQSLRVS
jgi:hypothetical protein